MSEPQIMINWDDKTARWIWVIAQVTAEDEVTVLSAGAHDSEKGAATEAFTALRTKHWAS